ncbi:MAG TPA: ATP-binding protein [Bryobacteraceae bacterium]
MSLVARFKNPYNFASEATGSTFKGRYNEVQQLLDTVESGTHAAIYGLQRIGKTSLVTETMRERMRERSYLASKVVFVHVDCQKYGTEHATYKNILNALIREIGQQIAPTRAREIDDDLASVGRRYERGSKLEMLAAFRDLFSRTITSKRKIVLFLDEFSELCPAIERSEELLRRDPAVAMRRHPHEVPVDVDLMHWFSSLMKASEIQDRLVFVFALRPFMAEYDARKNLQLLKLTTPITLYHLAEGDAKALITEPLKEEIRVEPDGLQHLYFLTAGHPYLIQFMMQRIVDRLRQRKSTAVTKAYVEEFAEEMAAEGPGYEAQFKVLDSDYSVEEAVRPGVGPRIGKAALYVMAKFGVDDERWVASDVVERELTARGISPAEMYLVTDQLLRARIVEEGVAGERGYFRICVPLLQRRYIRQNMYQKYFARHAKLGG